MYIIMRLPVAKDDVTFGAAMSACGKAGQWEWAIDLQLASWIVKAAGQLQSPKTGP